MNIKTFWELLKDNIEIPRIQRNYVQGEKNKDNRLAAERLIENLLNNIKSKKKMELDLVYGSYGKNEEGKTFFPLDGQQRLTLLWIIHWYVLQRCVLATQSSDEERCSMYKEEIRKLQKFTYSTRASSRDFIRLLVEKYVVSDMIRYDIRSSIEDCRWFRTEWVFDPTIKNMLEVIVYVSNKLKPEETDNYYTEIWESLTKDITFRICDLDKFDQKDALFIKMNGRGKLLEPWENLKADLIFDLNKKDDGSDQKNDVNLKDLIKLFDSTWYQFFWKQMGKNVDNYYAGKIKNVMGPDAAFFQFICRVYLDKIIEKAAGNKEMTSDAFSKDRHWLEVQEMEKNIEYRFYDSLKDYTKDVLVKIRNIMNYLIQCKEDDIYKALLPIWASDEKKNMLIPHALESAECLNEEQRVAFHAFVLFVKEYSGNIKNDILASWMQFAWNIAHNCNSSLLEIFRFLDKVSEELFKGDISNKADFYSRLKDVEHNSRQTQLDRQIIEETEKAKLRYKHNGELQILDIIEKEFEGFARIFYRKGEDPTDHIDEKNINKRWQAWNAFNQWCPKCQTNDLLSCIGNDNELRGRHIFYPSSRSRVDRKKHWITDFRCLGEEWPIPLQVITRLLDGERYSDDDLGESSSENPKYYIKLLRDEKAVIEYILAHNSTGEYHLRDNHLTIYNNKVGHYIRLDNIGKIRSEMIRKFWSVNAENNKTYEKDYSIPGCNDYLYGKWIPFSYNGKLYNWHWDNRVYLINDSHSNGNLKEVKDAFRDLVSALKDFDNKWNIIKCKEELDNQGNIKCIYVDILQH